MVEKISKDAGLTSGKEPEKTNLAAQAKEDTAKPEGERPAYLDAEKKRPDSVRQAMQAGTDPAKLKEHTQVVNEAEEQLRLQKEAEQEKLNKRTPHTLLTSNEPLSPPDQPPVESPVVPLPGETPSDWVDHGIIDVKVADLPWPEGVTSPADFERISWEDAQAATLRLPEIQKQLSAGVQPDDLTADDHRVYGLYYGGQPVKLALINGEYDIDGGRHRVYAAKALGLETLPARVKEKLG
jgi:hypothetical protein